MIAITITEGNKDDGEPRSRDLGVLDCYGQPAEGSKASQQVLYSERPGITGLKRGWLLRGFRGSVSFPAGTTGGDQGERQPLPQGPRCKPCTRTKDDEAQSRLHKHYNYSSTHIDSGGLAWNYQNNDLHNMGLGAYAEPKMRSATIRTGSSKFSYKTCIAIYKFDGLIECFSGFESRSYPRRRHCDRCSPYTKN